MSERDLLLRTAEIAADFLESLHTRRVYPEESIEELGHALGGPLPAGPSDPLDVIEQLARDAGRGVVASPSGRYFGFVIGGALPVGGGLLRRRRGGTAGSLRLDTRGIAAGARLHRLRGAQVPRQ